MRVREVPLELVARSCLLDCIRSTSTIPQTIRGGVHSLTASWCLCACQTCCCLSLVCLTKWAHASGVSREGCSAVGHEVRLRAAGLVSTALPHRRVDYSSTSEFFPGGRKGCQRGPWVSLDGVGGWLPRMGDGCLGWGVGGWGVEWLGG